jgi:hypothetical protein
MERVEVETVVHGAGKPCPRELAVAHEAGVRSMVD